MRSTSVCIPDYLRNRSYAPIAGRMGCFQAAQACSERARR